MELARLLDIRPGITALIGSGGKTTLMYTLARELARQGRVIVTTSTKIYRPNILFTLISPGKADILSAFAHRKVLCVGAPGPEGKLTAPELSFGELAALADYVLVEADGSKGRPLKAHASHEPVIPQEANQSILVLGADGFGKPVSEVCHRPELFAKIANLREKDLVTPESLAKVLNFEGLSNRVFINQVETEEALALAKNLGAWLACPVVAGSLRKGEYQCLF